MVNPRFKCDFGGKFRLNRKPLDERFYPKIFIQV